MDRRKFFSRVTAATATTVALGAGHKPSRTVNYTVRGFTCITCAVGLETMLRGLKGVSSAKASYPANKVAIEFDEQAIAEAKLKEFIVACGFLVV